MTRDRKLSGIPIFCYILIRLFDGDDMLRSVRLSDNILLGFECGLRTCEFAKKGPGRDIFLAKLNRTDLLLLGTPIDHKSARHQRESEHAESNRLKIPHKKTRFSLDPSLRCRFARLATKNLTMTDAAGY